MPAVSRLCHLPAANLYDWPGKELPRPEDVVQHAEANNEAYDQYTVIHGLSGSRRRPGPEAEEKENNQVSTGEQVVRDAEETRHVPWTPHDVRILDRELRPIDPYRFDGAGDTAVEE